MLKMGIIGQAARKEVFMPRPGIRRRIQENLDKGGDVLLVAPRRVGKSSILFDLLDNPTPKTLVTYYTSESVNSENEYYKKLFHHIVEKLEGVTQYQKRITTFTKDLLSRINEIGLEGSIKIGESKISYYHELEKLLNSLDLGDEKLLVLNDELSSTVENIIRDFDSSTAIHFLQTFRELRQSPKIQKKVQFVIAGSIGLENIVGKLDSINLINDLIPVAIPPLKKNEAYDLTELILTDSSVNLLPSGFERLLNVIEWWIPYYFQILLDESYNQLQDIDDKQINDQVIDRAVKKALKVRTYFEHWFVRLRKAYEKDDFSFVKDVLNIASENTTIASAEIIDLATRHNIGDTYKNLINTLIYDGYINNDDDPKTYRFNSPLLREWWRNNVAN